MTANTHQHTHKRTARPKLSIPAPQFAPEAPWEGEFHAGFRSGNTYIVPVKAVLRLHAAMIDGRGRSLTYPTGGASADREFEVTGARHFSKVTIDLWFAGKSIAHRPWTCDGHLNAGQDAITGEWWMQCLDPPECDCGGPSGRFELKRCR